MSKKQTPIYPNALACPRCAQPLRPPAGLGLHTQHCIDCRRNVDVVVFPRLLAPLERGIRGERLIDESEASCFYHTENRAQTGCEGCGRFICALCEVPVDGASFCPSCVQAGKTGIAAHGDSREEFLWEDLATGLAALSVLIFYLAPLCFLFLLVITPWKWRTVGRSITPRSRTKLLVSLLLSFVVSGISIALITSAFREGF